MSAEFSEFTEAVAARSGGGTTASPSQSFDHVCVLGGGTDARLLAALCLSNDARVTLFSAYGKELDEIGGGITVRGAGPVGSYQVNQAGIPSINAVAEIDKAVSDANLLFLTGPIHKQRTYAMVLADHLRDGQVIVVPNARTFGALETARLLRIGGVSADITIVEMQGLPFWATQEGSTLHLSSATPRMAATLPTGRQSVLDALGQLIGPVLSQVNVLQTSLMDTASAVEYPALCLGGLAIEPGGPEIVSGGVPLQDNQTFRNKLGPQHQLVIEALMKERAAVAAAFGVRDVPGIGDALDCIAGQPSGPGARPVCNANEARSGLRDTAIGSLLPMIALGEVADLSTPVTQGAVATISTILGSNLTGAGRSLSGLGLVHDTLDNTRRQLEQLVKGAL